MRSSGALLGLLAHALSGGRRGFSPVATALTGTTTYPPRGA
ncbi:hypothetical protein [Pseudonocardia sp. H11422]|nr:hypothetical protein [Pseudonocardia sp. H11422]